MTTTKIEMLGITAITVDGTFSAKMGGDMVTIDGWAIPGGVIPFAPQGVRSAEHEEIWKDAEQSLIPARCSYLRAIGSSDDVATYRVIAYCSDFASGEERDIIYHVEVGQTPSGETAYEGDVRAIETAFLEYLGWDVFGMTINLLWS